MVSLLLFNTKNRRGLFYFDRFRMVVIETKSQIIEIQSHEIAAAQHINTASHSSHGKHPPPSFSIRLS